VLRQFDTPVSSGTYVSKRDSSSPNAGWRMQAEGTLFAVTVAVDDGPDIAVLSNAAGEVDTFTAGALTSVGFVMRRSDDTLEAVLDGALQGTTESVAAVGDCSNALPMRIGNTPNGTSFYQDFELHAVYIWREALTAAELAAIAADWGAA